MTTIKQKGRHSGKSATPTTMENDTALVHLSKGVPVTDSLTIAREFGRSHGHVLREIDALISNGTINQSNFGLITYSDKRGRQQRMIELDERGALVSMPFIGGSKSHYGQAKLVDAFLALRNAQLKAANAQAKIERNAARREAATSYRAVSMTLNARRAEDGKSTAQHHYANEARLINFAFTGSFAPLNRDELTNQDLRDITSLEVRDLMLIGMGKSYNERKIALVQYAQSLRTPRLRAKARQAIAANRGGSHAQ